MIKTRSILILTIIPLAIGYLFAMVQTPKSITNGKNHTLDIRTSEILPTDMITLSEQGDIISITHNEVKDRTQNQHLIEPVRFGSSYLAIDKQTNYASLIEFSQSGNMSKILVNGNTGNVDTDTWIADIAVRPNKQDIVFVSDKDRLQTQISDNVLYDMNIKSGKTTVLARPNPGSGGIAHPVWNPVDADMLLYDFYAYDEASQPYSTIIAYNIKTGVRIPLTTGKDNAYQASISPDGKEVVYLERNSDNTVDMYIADVTPEGLRNIKSIANGDFAYPVFSYTQNHIYFLKAQGNEAYSLYTGTISHGKFTNVSALSGPQLSGSSGFTIAKNQ